MQAHFESWEYVAASFAKKTFSEVPPCDGMIDVCAASSTTVLKNAERIIGQMWALHKTGGKIFQMLVAEGSYGCAKGEEVDSHTRVDIAEGPFKGVGLVHFFTIRADPAAIRRTMLISYKISRSIQFLPEL